MYYIIDTVKDLKTVMDDLDLPGEGDLQHLRFLDGKVLIVNVDEKKFGNVITLSSEMP
jgi:hypothetical protein